MRAELAQRGGRTGTPVGGKASSQPAAPASANLRTEVATLVRGVDLTDPVAMRAARRRVIRAVLLNELGPELREYSQWQPMLDTLVDSLEANDAHRESFESFIKSVSA